MDDRRVLLDMPIIGSRQGEIVVGENRRWKSDDHGSAKRQPQIIWKLLDDDIDDGSSKRIAGRQGPYGLSLLLISFLLSPNWLG